MGINEVQTAPHSPWQNPFAERLVGSIRRECLNHVLILGERHLRRVLTRYFDYYHRARRHLSLDKDAPDVRAVELPEAGRIVEIPEVGGLHHRYIAGRPSTTVSKKIGLSPADAHTTDTAVVEAVRAPGAHRPWRSRWGHGVQAAPGAPRGVKPLGRRGARRKARGSGGESLARSAARKAYAAMHNAP